MKEIVCSCGGSEGTHTQGACSHGECDCKEFQPVEINEEENDK